MSTRRPATPPRIPGARYLSFLGSGGFADVYLYEQQIPRREIAVKVMRRGATEEMRRAFRAEANLMARMSSHPSILSVYGAGEADDHRMYLMMEYCPPPHLGALLRERRLTVSNTLEMGIQIAGAVETLHRAGIVHRDIKPANILMTAFHHPVLTDFGIATYVGDPRPAEGFSVPWSSPEQATGVGEAGVAGDVYSLAATVYTMLAGHAPFEIEDGDNSEIAVINRVLRSPVPSTGRFDVPEEMERVLATAMAKEPQQRYADALEFARALQSVQSLLHQQPTSVDVLAQAPAEPGSSEPDDDATRMAVRTINPLPSDGATAEPESTEESGSRRRARVEDDADDVTVQEDPEPRGNGVVGWIITLVVVAAIIGAAWWAIFHTDAEEDPHPIPTEPHPTTSLDDYVYPVTGLRGELSADGEHVIFSWKNGDGNEGDTFQYTLVGADQVEVYESTTEMSVTVPKRIPETCLKVLVENENGFQSKEEHACVTTTQ